MQVTTIATDIRRYTRQGHNGEFGGEPAFVLSDLANISDAVRAVASKVTKKGWEPQITVLFDTGTVSVIARITEEDA